MKISKAREDRHLAPIAFPWVSLAFSFLGSGASPSRDISSLGPLAKRRYPKVKPRHKASGLIPEKRNVDYPRNATVTCPGDIYLKSDL